MSIRKELEKELARRSYLEYCIYAHGGKWIPGKHLRLICDTVEDLIYDRLKENILIISMPPQHGKSQSITETLPSYYLGKFPDKRVIEASYGDDLAQRFGRRNRDKIKDYGKELFDIEIKRGRDSATNFEISEHSGSMISRGIMSGITGQPGDLIIIDDPIKNRQEADSETYRARVWEEFLNSIYTRLSASGKIILILTRWHEDDLAGRLLTNMPGKCLEINIPLEAGENDILDRQPGDALFPEIGKDNNWLKEFKKVYTTEEGSRAWNALMQGQPTAQEGNLIKRKWWKYYDRLPGMIQTIMSVDATFKDGDNSDYVAIQVWGKRDADMYLIDALTERMDFPTTLQAIINMKAKYRNIGRIFVEDKANGSAIISMLRRKIPGVIGINPEGGKVARVNAVSGAIEAGNVFLPNNKQFTFDFVDQCSKFPNGVHDDMVDAMSQALNRFIYYSADIPKEIDPNIITPEQKHNNMVKDITGGSAPEGFLDFSIY